MNIDEESIITTWLKKLDSGESRELSLWQEAMAQTRQLHTDIWNGVMFFFTVNGVLIAAIFAIAAGEDRNLLHGILIWFLALFGVTVTVVGFKVFKKHREYYVQMLMRKTLLEKEMGFYEVSLSGQDLTFPWKVDKLFLSQLVSDPESWLIDHRFRVGTNSRLLLYVYCLLIAIYVVILVAVSLVMFAAIVLEVGQYCLVTC